MTTSAVRVFLICFCAAVPGAAQVRPDAPTMEFVTIQPGTFRMGCSEGDRLCDPDENPPHVVRLTRSFSIGKYEVTQAQWSALMERNPSRFKGETLPVENITFDQVQEFLKRLNALNDGFKYRLPAEAEWEYAARAGTAGPNTGPLGDVAWYMENSGGMSHPVGQKKPNAWGLHDMEGNVYEWTQDWFFDYEEDPQTDPRGPETGYERVPRGGSWESTPKGIRTSNRNQLEPDGANYNVGFRLVRDPA
jgi:formylglycine-generating enzyme required for sulfatase activity